MTACGNSSSNADESKTENSSSEVETTTTTTTTSATTTTTATTTTSKTTTTTTAAPVADVKYISERMVQYDEQKKVYQVMFALLDSNNKYVAAPGVATIKISDVKGNVLYNKDISFTALDHCSWTNRMKDEPTYGFWLEIPRTDLKGGTSSSGTLSLIVKGDYYMFDEEKLNISDLPQKKGKVVLPNTPVSITDMRYSNHTSYVTINSASYETDYSSDGEMTLTIKLVVTLSKKVGEENIASSVAVGYRLKDSEGFVVASDVTYTDDLRTGEKTREEFKIYDLDPSLSYTLTFENAK